MQTTAFTVSEDGQSEEEREQRSYGEPTQIKKYIPDMTLWVKLSPLCLNRWR